MLRDFCGMDKRRKMDAFLILTVFGALLSRAAALRTNTRSKSRGIVYLRMAST
jgi:hypothetical protein